MEITLETLTVIIVVVGVFMIAEKTIKTVVNVLLSVVAISLVVVLALEIDGTFSVAKFIPSLSGYIAKMPELGKAPNIVYDWVTRAYSANWFASIMGNLKQ